MSSTATVDTTTGGMERATGELYGFVVHHGVQRRETAARRWGSVKIEFVHRYKTMKCEGTQYYTTQSMSWRICDGTDMCGSSPGSAKTFEEYQREIMEDTPWERPLGE